MSRRAALQEMSNRMARLGLLRNTAYACAAFLVLGMIPAGAQTPPSDPAAVIRGFYATLLSTMAEGRKLGPQGRYERLEPVIRKTFDMPFMSRLAVGPSWRSLPAAQRQGVTAAFERYVSATYAERFDRYSGEKFEIDGERLYGAEVIVETRIIKSNGEPVEIDYLMRQNPDGWRIADVYLEGTISQLATERSEFASILARSGVAGLIARLRSKADSLLVAVIASS